MADEVKPATDTEMALAFGVPAPFVNRFLITIGGQTARIAFGEQHAPDQPAGIRSAVTMAIGDMVQLRDALDVLVKQFKVFEIPPQQDGNG